MRVRQEQPIVDLINSARMSRDHWVEISDINNMVLAKNNMREKDRRSRIGRHCHLHIRRR